MKDYEALTEGAVDRFWTIPNIITLTRILMLIPIVYLLHEGTPQSFLWAFILLIFAYFTDMLDGMVARLTKQVSKVGMILDPVSDKLLAITISSALFMLGKLPFYFFILIVLREVGITVGAFYSITTKRIITLPSIWGKIHTFVFGIVISCYPLKYSSLMDSNYVFLKNLVNVIVKYGTFVSIFFLVLSSFIYGLRFIKDFVAVRNSDK